jgi:hypothetical protein
MVQPSGKHNHPDQHLRVFATSEANISLFFITIQANTFPALEAGGPPVPGDATISGMTHPPPEFARLPSREIALLLSSLLPSHLQ